MNIEEIEDLINYNLSYNISVEETLKSLNLNHKNKILIYING